MSERRGPVVVGVVLVALVLGSTMLGSAAGANSVTTAAVTQPGSALAAKKKVTKGTLKIVVTGSGSYTVKGKGFRRSGSASKSFKVKPGAYTVKAPSGLVDPGTVRVRKSKVSKIKVTFPAQMPAPAPSVTPSPLTTSAPSPSPSPTITPSPTVTPTPTDSMNPGETRRISVSGTGIEADDSTEFIDGWSPDGSQVLFHTRATNLVPGDTNGDWDIFAKSLTTGAILRVNTAADGTPSNDGATTAAWSPDGTRVAIGSSGDIVIKTLATGATEVISSGLQGWSDGPVWSPDGTRIVYDNLHAGQEQAVIQTLASGQRQTFPFPLGVWSPDSSKIAFSSTDSALVPSDTNGTSDVFVLTLSNGSIARVSTDSAGNQADQGSNEPKWSPDGTSIAFLSQARNLLAGDTNQAPDVYVKNLITGAIQRVSTDQDGVQGNGWTFDLDWSPDGESIAFSSYSSNLVLGDTNDSPDIFVKTLDTGSISRVSTGSSGSQADAGVSGGMLWSPNGTRIAFVSWATNLVTGDTNGKADVFVKRLR